MFVVLSWRLLRRKDSTSQENPITPKIQWQLHSKRQNSVCLNTYFPFIIFMLLSSSFPQVQHWKKNTAKGCCRSLSCFILFPYFSVIWSHSQFKPAQVSVPANRKYFALFISPYPAASSYHLSSPSVTTNNHEALLWHLTAQLIFIFFFALSFIGSACQRR